MDRDVAGNLVLPRIPVMNQVIQETIQLSSEIGTTYPELHKFLDETPLLLSNMHHVEICTPDFEKYLQTLKAHMLNHIDTRQ